MNFRKLDPGLEKIANTGLGLAMLAMAILGAVMFFEFPAVVSVPLAIIGGVLIVLALYFLFRFVLGAVSQKEDSQR